MPGDRRRMVRALQAASDQLCAGLYDRFIIGVTKAGRICLNGRVWTSAMTYRSIYFDWSNRYVDEIIGGTSGRLNWKAVAPTLMEALIGPTIQVQEARWALARTLGLSRDGHVADLPSDDMMIDRTLLAMLQAEGIDARRTGRDVEPGGDFVTGDELPLMMVGANLGKWLFVRQEGSTLPVIGGWVHVGRACYDGTVLQLNGSMPATIMLAAPGRRLGDVVSTGIASIDDRLIVDFAHAGCGPQEMTTWDTGMELEIWLSPDQVRLGDAPLLQRSRARARQRVAKLDF